MANPARAYLATQVETTTQGELLIMLYEAAIKFLKRAKIEIDNKDYAKKGIYISKAMAIIHELMESLNKEKGGDITPKLSSLYHFCTSHLIKANIRMDKKMIDDVIKILDGIRSAYAQIIPAMEGKTAPTAAKTASPVPPQTPAGKPQAPKAPSKLTPEMAQVQHAAQAQQAAQAQKAQQAAHAQIAQGQQATPPPPPTQQTADPQQVAPETQAEAPQAPPVQKPQQPTPPPKLRNAINAAKFRAANAYSNNR